MEQKTKWHKVLRMTVKVVLCIVALLVAYVFLEVPTGNQGDPMTGMAMGNVKEF